VATLARTRGDPLKSLSADAVTALGGPDWLVRSRLEAYERFAASGLPSPEEEIWRYSRVADLDLDGFEAATARPGAGASLPGPAGALPGSMDASVAGAQEPAARIEVVDGVLTGLQVGEAARRAGLSVRRLSELDEAPGEGLGQLGQGADAFVDLAGALAPDGLLIELPAGRHVEGSVVLSHRIGGGGRATASRTIVSIGRSSQLSVVELIESDDTPALHVPVVELHVGEAANLDYAGVQLLGRSAWCLGHQVSQVGRDSNLRSLSVALGGYYARLRSDSRLVGVGGSSRLLALYFGEGDQMLDFRTLQDHAAPKTTSDLLFKGAVLDQAQGVYSGLIRVRRGAEGTNAFQTNRNLVLSEGATAWSVPNLEIEENDVRCSHASAMGPVDEEQMYYLQSRGIPPKVAERLIVLGFFDDLLAGAPATELHGPVRQAVSDKLDRHLGFRSGIEAS
jgi:Fe-S cluster assembly protein SufD